jgi:hypothetical protein
VTKWWVYPQKNGLKRTNRKMCFIEKLHSSVAYESVERVSGTLSPSSILGGRTILILASNPKPTEASINPNQISSFSFNTLDCHETCFKNDLIYVDGSYRVLIFMLCNKRCHSCIGLLTR